MKHTTICLALSVLFLQVVKSQDSLKAKGAETPHSTYSIRLNLLQGQSFTVHLMDIKDSSVFVFQKKSLAPDPFHKGKTLMNIDSNWDQYNYRFITSIKVRNKKLRTWTILSGLVVGTVAGIAIATNGGSGSGYAEGAAVVLGLLLGGGVGAVTGVIVSSALEKKYLINGDWRSFEEMKASLQILKISKPEFCEGLRFTCRKVSVNIATLVKPIISLVQRSASRNITGYNFCYQRIPFTVRRSLGGYLLQPV